MGKKKGGHGKRKFRITPRALAIAAPAGLGLWAAGQQVWVSYSIDKDPLHATTGIVARDGKITLDKAVPIGLITKAGGGIVASKVVKAGLNMAGKAVPGASRVLNITIAKVG